MTTASTTDRVALVRAIASQHLYDRGPLMPVLHEVMASSATSRARTSRRSPTS